ncbi:MAG: hypothetical protein KDD61_08870, partial [Bdellovibrionales bacterium]|nr:hypothetical protein [Bdellovibrionales bacterium]
LAQLFQVEGKIGIRWTNSMITVKDGSSTRDSQAVTDPEKSLMTFRQDSFLGMSPSDRVFLLAHEALHFTKWEDHFLNDSGEIGPFLGEDGKRHFINAMSAAIVMMAYEKKLFEKYQIVLKRPRPWKNHWLEVEGGTVTWSETDNNTYSNDTLGTFAVAYRYQLNSQWGLRVASRQESEERTLKTQISLKEQTSTIGLGVTYRYFFRPDPFTYWGNSHFVGSAMIEKIQGTYDIVDNFTGTKEESSSYGMSLGGRFYMPALLKAYWYIGFSMGYHSLNYKGINLKYDSLRNSAMVGVSYGF